MPDGLSLRQKRFVAEFCKDQNATRAAIAAGFNARTASSQASRLLRNVNLRAAIDEVFRVRAEKYEVTADKVVRQLSRIALADPRRYVDEHGEPRPLSELSEDEALAINSFEIEDVVDRRTGEVRQRTKVKLADRNVALASLTKVLGMVVDRHLVEGSVELRIKSMTPEERVARVCELREKARREYLPVYRAMMAANGSPVIDGTAVQGDAADDQPAVGTPAAQPEPSAGLGSGLPVNGGGVDQPRRAAREEILDPVNAEQTSGWQMWPGHNTRR